MKIQQEQDGKSGWFYIKENDLNLAEMTYSIPENGKMIINHTEVGKELRGKNIGFQLVKAGVEFARTNHLKILPLCSYAKSVFDKMGEEFSDVLFTD